MADPPFQDGTVPFVIPRTKQHASTYYKIIGDISRDAPRLVVLHGGPGTGHEYLLPFSQLWQSYQIPVVFYDQIGCAASTHLPETAGDESFWQEDLFLAELNNLLDVLQLRTGPGFHILGHSWGGRLVAAFAATRPPGLQKLVIASGIASTQTSIEGLKILCQKLPADTQRTIEEAEASGNFNNPQFQEALGVFYREYFCRVEPFPPKELLPALKHMSEDKTVRNTVSGPSPFNCTGSFRDWTCIPRLQQIAVPTLVYSGDYDTSHEITTVPFCEHIPDVRRIKFQDAGHMCHLEKPEIAEGVFKAVGEFLK